MFQVTASTERKAESVLNASNLIKSSKNVYKATNSTTKNTSPINEHNKMSKKNKMHKVHLFSRAKELRAPKLACIKDSATIRDLSNTE